jgi:uncharacterized protein (DUF2249 family)
MVFDMPPESRKMHTLDVRPLIAQGKEPFSKIMQLVADLGPGESLLLIAPFLPAPLIERLKADGFTAKPERAADGAWRTLFARQQMPKRVIASPDKSQ